MSFSLFASATEMWFVWGPEQPFCSAYEAQLPRIQLRTAKPHIRPVCRYESRLTTYHKQPKASPSNVMRLGKKITIDLQISETNADNDRQNWNREVESCQRTQDTGCLFRLIAKIKQLLIYKTQKKM